MENKHEGKRGSVEDIEDNIEGKDKVEERLQQMKKDDTDGATGIVKEDTSGKDKQLLIDYITKSNDKKREELACPVCVYTMEPPIYQCPEGHLICCSCKPKLTRCPSCRFVYNTGNSTGNKRNRYAENDAEKLAEEEAILQKLKTENPNLIDSDQLQPISQLAHADKNEQQQQQQQQQQHETGIHGEFQTFYQYSGLSGYKYWFRLKGENKKFFRRFGRFFEYGITSISIARNRIIILYSDGDIGWSGVPKALDNMFGDRQSSLAKPNVVVLGQRSDMSYFIQFADGKYEFEDVPRMLERHLVEGGHGAVDVIAIGDGDYFYVKFVDGHEFWNLPASLENLLQDRKQTREYYCNPSLAQVTNITFSTNSDYAVRFSDGKWFYNQAMIFDKQDVKFIQSKQISNVVFGNGSDFIVMYKINSRGEDAI